MKTEFLGELGSIFSQKAAGRFFWQPLENFLFENLLGYENQKLTFSAGILSSLAIPPPSGSAAHTSLLRMRGHVKVPWQLSL